MKKLYFIFTGLILMLVALAGCGSGGGTGGASNARIDLSVSSTDVPAGKSIPVDITITGDFPSLNGIESLIESDNTNFVVTTAASKSNAGKASATVYIKNSSATQATVNIRAKVKDSQITSAWKTLTVKPNTLLITAPASNDYTVKVPAGDTTCADSPMRIVTSGATAEVKDSSGTGISSAQVNISITSITNGSASDTVVFFPNQTNEVKVPPYTNTIPPGTTDTSGKYLWPVAIDGEVKQTKGDQHVFTINWKSTTTINGDNNLPLTYTDTKQTMITIKCE